jgi:hypothetical protein
VLSSDGIIFLKTIKPRRFTLVDAIVLIAATAIGLAPIRYFVADGFGEAISAPASWEFVAVIALDAYWILTPLLLTWTLALWLLRLRQPRPRFRRLVRQPGMAATTAILLTVLILPVKVVGMFAVAWLAGSYPFVAANNELRMDIFFVYARHYLTALCDGVLAAWLVLWLARVWRSESSWIDRAGRALGIFVAIYSALFSCVAFVR